MRHINKQNPMVFGFVLLFITLFSGFLWQSAALASQVVLPTKDNVLMQTNGPEAPLEDGDYWSKPGFPPAGPQTFWLVIPEGVPGSFQIKLQIWDPESFSNNLESATDTDEQKGNGWEATTYRLYAPDGTQITEKIFPGGTPETSQQWVDFHTMAAGAYGPGRYKITVHVAGDDQNGYKLGVEEGDAIPILGSGNEIGLYAEKAAFQYVGEGELSNTFWFNVDQRPELRLFNFDLEEGSSVRYISPSGVNHPGTASINSHWNTNPPSTMLPGTGGDVITNPEPGMWQAVITVTHPSPRVREGNQFIFYPDGLLFDGPPTRYNGVVGDRVWLDANQNGLQDDGEKGIPFVTVRLLDAETDLTVRSEHTDLHGIFLFEHVKPGNYKLEYHLPANFFFTAPRVGSDREIDSDADPNTGRTGSFFLAANEVRRNLDAGMIPKHVSNLRVTKVVETGDLELLPGDEATFIITVTNLGPHEATNVRTTDNISEALELIETDRYWDSGPNPLVWVETALPVNESVVYKVRVRATQVLGEIENCAWVSSPNKDTDLVDNSSCVVLRVEQSYPGGSGIKIGDLVWEDLDRDGLQDAGEPGMRGVTVNLLSGVDNTLVMTAITDNDGLYQFADMAAGLYYLEFVLPANYLFTKPNQDAADLLDSDADQATGKTGSLLALNGISYMMWDAGLVLYVPPPKSNIDIGDLVWKDLDGDGIQDPNEPGIAGVTVNLLSGQDETMVMSTQTSEAGLYLFEDMAPGYYLIEVVLPANYRFTLLNQGIDDSKDSDIIPESGKSAAFNVVANNAYLDNDAGLTVYVPPVESNITIGDKAWHDLDEDGIQDPNEPPMTGVGVRLVTAAEDAVILSTTTDYKGEYLFEDVPPGDYRIIFTLPAGFHFTLENAGSDDAVDSDANPVTGRTASFSVISNHAYMTWDAGLIENPESDLEVTKVIEESRSYIYRGESVSFLITVTNNGPDAAQGVRVIDNLPDGLEFTSAERNQDEGPNPLVWREALLPVGGTVSYRVVMRTTEELGGMDNCVTVSSNSFDPDLANNIACAQVHILVPVELSSFSARSVQGRVVINWVTQSETENLGFHILRSDREEGVYTRVNQEIIQGAGTSSSVNSYQYVDEAELKPEATYFYKLVDVDYKGRLNTHGPVNATVVVPMSHALEQNYPNPFNPETRISFSLKEAGRVNLTVFNVRGEVVRTLASGQMDAGAHMVVWDGRNDAGQTMPSGMYIYTLRVNNFEQKRTMMFLK